MRVICSVIVIAVLLTAITAISVPLQSPPAQGVFTSIVSPPSGFSLKGMSEQSELIIEAHVQSVFASEDIGTGQSHLETDSLILVDRVLKGPQPSPSQVVVAQVGGTKSGVEVKNVDQDLMKPGEHYVLFLQKIESLPPSPERTSTLKIRGNIPRYEIYYKQIGLFQVVNNQIRSGKASDFRSAFNSMSLTDFLGRVTNLLAAK